jgi:hypothetical protein
VFRTAIPALQPQAPKLPDQPRDARPTSAYRGFKLRSAAGIAYTRGGPGAMAITVDGMAAPDYSPDNPGSLLTAELARMLADSLAVR